MKSLMQFMITKKLLINLDDLPKPGRCIIMNEDERKKLEAQLSFEDKLIFDYLKKIVREADRGSETATFYCKDCIQKFTTEQYTELRFRVAHNYRIFEAFLTMHTQQEIK